jgi:hypothetical protein
LHCSYIPIQLTTGHTGLNRWGAKKSSIADDPNIKEHLPRIVKDNETVNEQLIKGAPKRQLMGKAVKANKPSQDMGAMFSILRQKGLEIYSSLPLKQTSI